MTAPRKITSEAIEQELRSRQRYLAQLNDITRTSLEAVDLKTMLQTLADQLGELFDADGCFITLWSEEEGRTIPTAAYGDLRETYPQQIISSDEATMTASVLKAGRPLVAEDVFNSPYISPRLAALFPTKSMLGLPLIANDQKLGAALISFSQTHHFVPDEIERGEQAAAQIALAIAKTRLLEIEQQRTAQLVRANNLIAALSSVAARIGNISNPGIVMETLGYELKQIGINCIVTLQEAGSTQFTIQYISIESNLIAMMEKLAGMAIHDFRFTAENLSFYKQVVINRKPVFAIEVSEVAEPMLKSLNPFVVKQILRLVLSDTLRSAYLPLIINDQVSGVLMLWGENLLESDMPAISIFASQVAITLENARLYAEVQQLAITDVLLEIYNRRGLFSLGAREIERAQRTRRPLSAVILDLDFFKRVNDTYGHASGDEVLHEVAQRCRSNIRGIDLIGRYGGEEFAVLLPETDLPAAHIIAERLRTAVANTPIATQRGGGITLTISLGVAALTASTPDLATLLRHADEALYVAKRRGRNRVEVKL
ncbi:MAG: diguanylate cyclase [Chloroflexi bacterium]|nr:diguanylate cyclase [Chloroflexota bacterium]